MDVMVEDDSYLGSLRGVYVLVLRFLKDVAVRVGSLGEVRFNFGYYGYVGSGMGRGASSLFGRIRRHLSNSKLIFWHIDYVTSLDEVKVAAVFFAESGTRLEHAVSKALKAVGAIVVRGFGSSDCDEGCGGHMFFIGNSLEEAFSTIFNAFKKLGIESKVLSFPKEAW
ncbi:MAG: GIY-YIG nuclease family protein [Candidatus Freyarchaeota archaeon]|nr:GIY-YIG nuclease family protein [Candidatus Jordarchaeia archaeon]